ncbi:MAG: lactate utilization protein [Candidatus Pseudobacter hemicellulosilyticus]|uniref:Lactate utilization protein n=1 Tax=Candidatus Pseudobacter hemicellulosilyticus TaxID=3121375 RepID=A0AAJ5WS98_9BACT|nr:MAG: lactate utilization protein [Pseudobacter sp.]
MISPSKENILKKIRKALTQSTPLPFPQSEGNSSVFQPSQQELEVEFAEQFTRLQGKFVFCANYAELVLQLQNLLVHNKWEKALCQEEGLMATLAANGYGQPWHPVLSTCDVAITSCDYLVARTGSVVLSSGSESGRTTSVYAPVHICIATSSQLVYDIKDALQGMREKYGSELPSQISFATGPSRTADIEKTLVVGIHGPGEAYVFLVDQ